MHIPLSVQPAPVPPETKVCSQCLADLPITQFRRRSKGSDARSSDCRGCHTKAERDRLRTVRQKSHRDALDAWGRSVTATDLPTLEAVTKLVMKKFDGPGRFFAAFKQMIDDCQDERVQPAARIRFFEALMSLSIRMSERESDRMENISTEDLERIHQQALAKMIVATDS